MRTLELQTRRNQVQRVQTSVSLEIPGVAPPNNSDDIDEKEVPQSIPGGRSIAHNILNNQHCPFLSIDIETGGDIAGAMSRVGRRVVIDLVRTHEGEEAEAEAEEEAGGVGEA